jgi:hypothetical protein
MELIQVIPIMEKVRFAARKQGIRMDQINDQLYLFEFKKVMDEMGAKGFIYVGLIIDQTSEIEAREDYTSFAFQKTDKKYEFEMQPDLIHTWYKNIPKGSVMNFTLFKDKIEKEYPNICGTMYIPDINDRVFFILAKEIKNDITGKTATENVGTTEGVDEKPDGKTDGQRSPKKSSAHR